MVEGTYRVDDCRKLEAGSHVQLNIQRGELLAKQDTHAQKNKLKQSWNCWQKAGNQRSNDVGSEKTRTSPFQ
jgi:hypothetical protein